MLSGIRRIFARSWIAFQKEAGRRDPEDQVAELLSGMRREMVEARAAIPLLEREVAHARVALQKERAALADCRRRGELAARIGDAETARVAEEHAERHARRVSVLEGKLTTAEEEHGLRAEEAERMSREYKRADADRFSLLARLRASGARTKMAGDGNFDDFARMEEEIEREAAHVDALEELSDLSGSSGTPPPQPPDVEDRLREMKRRMGQE